MTSSANLSIYPFRFPSSPHETFLSLLSLVMDPTQPVQFKHLATGDNIFGFDATDPAKSLNAAFAPAISSKIPWAAVLGNHDQESTLSREGVMKHIVGLKNTLSQVNPVAHVIDGFGNYNLQVGGVEGSSFENKSVLNLYFLDSGDYSTVSSIPGYGWIKPSQQLWFERTSKKLQVLTSLCIQLEEYGIIRNL